MRLLLDVGNTSVKWGVCRDGKIEDTGRFQHAGEDFAALAGKAWNDLPVPAAVAVANVAGPAMEETIAAWIRQRWDVTPVFVRSAKQAGGVTSAYAEPARLGVDRWAALVGARHLCSGAVCIVDCGTAVTLDLLGENGEHRGGLILPGVEMIQHMLLENTADIHVGAELPVARLFARDTGDAVGGGALYLLAAGVDRVVGDMAAAQGDVPEVVITGGDAPRILPLLARPARHEPDLVLQGLAVLSGEQ